jgi:hypothetical protein
MNTMHTGNSDGASEIAQEHRGITNHSKQTELVNTMNTSSTICDTTWPVRARVSGVPPVCWCGQDLEYVQHTHCPRCGTARARRFDSMRPPLAA